jgi:hypothetical protein
VISPTLGRSLSALSARTPIRQTSCVSRWSRSTRLCFLALLFLGACANAPANGPATLEPDAHVALASATKPDQSGLSTAEGIVAFHDRQYRIYFTGIAPSTARSTTSGRIYNLSRPDAIEGDYHAQYGGRLLTSPAGIQIVLFPPLNLNPGSYYVHVTYAGLIFPRGDATFPLQPTNHHAVDP